MKQQRLRCAEHRTCHQWRPKKTKKIGFRKENGSSPSHHHHHRACTTHTTDNREREAQQQGLGGTEHATDSDLKQNLVKKQLGLEWCELYAKNKDFFLKNGTSTYTTDTTNNRKRGTKQQRMGRTCHRWRPVRFVKGET